MFKRLNCGMPRGHAIPSSAKMVVVVVATRHFSSSTYCARIRYRVSVSARPYSRRVSVSSGEPEFFGRCGCVARSKEFVLRWDVEDVEGRMRLERPCPQPNRRFGGASLALPAWSGAMPRPITVLVHIKASKNAFG